MRDHDNPSISVKPILAVLTVVLIVLIVAMTALYGFYESYPQTPLPGARSTSAISVNADAVDQAQDQERQHLTHYGWISQADHIIHIPIDQAIDIIAGREVVAGHSAEPTARPHEGEEH